MKFDFKDTRIFLRPGVTDMRVSFEELLHVIKDKMGQNPLSGAAFIFCNCNKKILKIIWWDTNGFWTAQKKLESRTWPWPDTKEEARKISGEELKYILDGIDLTKYHYMFRGPRERVID